MRQGRHDRAQAGMGDDSAQSGRSVRCAMQRNTATFRAGSIARKSMAGPAVMTASREASLTLSNPVKQSS